MGETVKTTPESPVEFSLLAIDSSARTCQIKVKHMTLEQTVVEWLREGDRFSNTPFLGKSMLRLSHLGRNEVILEAIEARRAR